MFESNPALLDRLVRLDPKQFAAKLGASEPSPQMLKFMMENHPDVLVSAMAAGDPKFAAKFVAYAAEGHPSILKQIIEVYPEVLKAQMQSASPKVLQIIKESYPAFWRAYEDGRRSSQPK